MNRVHRIGHESTGKLLAEFSLPAVIAILVQSLYSIIDRVFIGNGAGTEAISGITVCFPVIALFMAFGMLIGIGGATLFSIRAGEGGKDECIKILHNTFILLSLISAILSITASLFLREILTLSGGSGAALLYGEKYLGILLLGLPFQTAGFGMNNFIRSEGRPGIAMSTMITGVVINTILTPLFIFRLGMGIEGAAISTVIAQSVSFLLVMYYFISGGSITGLRMCHLKIWTGITLRTLYTGFSTFIMQIGACITASIYNHQLMNYGDELTVSIYGIIHCITVFMLIPAIGISRGAQPLMGYNSGKGDTARTAKILKESITSSALIISAGFIPVMAMPGSIISIFNSADSLLVIEGNAAMRISLALLPLAVLHICASGYFLAIGDAKKSALLTFARQIIFLLPAVILLPSVYGVNGIWLAAPVSDFCSFILSLYLLFKNRFEHKIINRQCPHNGIMNFPVCNSSPGSHPLQLPISE
jgi:putative MATE family efflux protein